MNIGRMEFQSLYLCGLFFVLDVLVADNDYDQSDYDDFEDDGLGEIINTIGRFSEQMTQDLLEKESDYVENGVDDFSLDSASHQLGRFSMPDIEAARESVCGYFSIQSAKKFRALKEKESQYIKTILNKNTNARKLWTHYAKPYCTKPKRRIQCNHSSKYRTLDGSCNNENNVTWGMAHTPQRRFLRPAYLDGCDFPRQSGIYGTPLPSSRVVSNKLHKPGKGTRYDRKLTVMHMTWGQFLDHDIVFTPSLKGKDGANIQCCGLKESRPECFPISIPKDDPHFKSACMNFVRSSPASPMDRFPECREQLNTITSYIDASVVYGSSEKEMKSLRSFKHGKLKVKEGNMLPEDRKNKRCFFNDKEDYCPLGGEKRINLVPSIGSLHLLFLREHNRLAETLYKLNPKWEDERIFQEVRKIIGAMIQHITYSEYLPLVLGEDIMKKFHLNPKKYGFHTTYDENVDSSIRNSFAAAAFRFGHSQITNYQAWKDVDYKTIESTRIENSFFHTHMCTHGKGKVCEGVLRWQIDDRAAKSDGIFERGVRDQLFLDKEGKSFDLVASSIQRGRDHGVPAYVSWRKWCGLSYGKCGRWRYHSRSNKRILQNLYNHFSDIDLYSGAITEEPVQGGIVGPTFACILAEQFRLLKIGDRFWYENNRHPTGFTEEQLNAIKETTLSTIICNNVFMKTIQKRAFEQIGYGRKNYSDITDVAKYVDDHLKASGQLHGYRWMHHKCTQAGFVIQKESIRNLLRVLDPTGVSIRRQRKLKRREYVSRGPNYIWHLDSYDKLKPYGICINGCIDGFSRHIIWMEAGQTNSDPYVVGGYYCQAVLSTGGVPNILRGDMGTENSLVAELHTAFTGDNGRFLYGTSQHNQRIESWWGILRRENINFWMLLFGDLKADGLFSGDILDKSLIQFCFLPLIKEELFNVVTEWNTHRIRKQSGQEDLNGRPITLYNLPHLYDTYDHLCAIDQDDMDLCTDVGRFADQLPCDQDIFELAAIYMERMQLQRPTDAFQGVNLYHALRNELRVDMHI